LILVCEIMVCEVEPPGMPGGSFGGFPASGLGLGLMAYRPGVNVRRGWLRLTVRALRGFIVGPLMDAFDRKIVEVDHAGPGTR
jgi:hypothetical protein